MSGSSSHVSSTTASQFNPEAYKSEEEINSTYAECLSDEYFPELEFTDGVEHLLSFSRNILTSSVARGYIDHSSLLTRSDCDFTLCEIANLKIKYALLFKIAKTQRLLSDYEDNESSENDFRIKDLDKITALVTLSRRLQVVLSSYVNFMRPLTEHDDCIKKRSQIRAYSQTIIANLQSGLSL